MDGADVVTPGPRARRAYYTSVKTQKKIKVSPLTGLQMEKNYVFRNPRDAIQNFCYALKKLPDHFKRFD